MSYYVIIRGPAAVGKTAVAERLARLTGGKRISFDDIMKENNLGKIKRGAVSEEDFLKANKIAIEEAKFLLGMEMVAVFDGAFYYKSQLDDLVEGMESKHLTFTLKAPLNECLARNRGREEKISEDGVRAVHKLVAECDAGIVVNTSGKTIKETIAEISEHLPALPIS